MKGSGMYLAKRRNDELTSCFVATRANLITSYNLHHAEHEMASAVSESASLSDH